MADAVLHDGLKDLTRRYLLVLSEVVHGRPPPANFAWGSVADYGIVDLHSFVTDPANEPLIATLLKRDEVATLLGGKGLAVVTMSFVYNILWPMVTRQLKLQGGLEFNEAAFEANYQEFGAYVRSAEDRYLFTAPLGNFGMASMTVSIHPFTIRRMTNDEFAWYNGFTTQQSPLLPAGRPVRPYECVLEREGTATWKEQPFPVSRYQDSFWWLLATMKLLKQGSVTYSTIVVRPLSWTGMSFGVGAAYPNEAILEKPYTLTNDDVPELQRLWSDFINPMIGGQPPFWMIALQRFYDAVDRHRPEEALVDFWIACESLFGEDIDIGELAYRLSLRMAHFIETDPIARQKIREAAMKAYRARGRIVHAGKPIEAAHGVFMEDITRKAIRKCIFSSYGSRKEMVAEVERSIIGETSGVRRP